MKTKKIIAAVTAAALAATLFVSVSADTELNEQKSGGMTLVTASIGGGSYPGDVSYIVTIPDRVRFGTLEQPSGDTNSYKFANFSVAATKLDIEDNQLVSVLVKDNTGDGSAFYLTQYMKEEPFRLTYDVYASNITTAAELSGKTPINADPDNMRANGYHVTSFDKASEGSSQAVTLVLNQRQIYGKDLDDISGGYYGNMVFYTSLSGQ